MTLCRLLRSASAAPKWVQNAPAGPVTTRDAGGSIDDRP